MTLIKICGLTNEADALLAAELGADMLGFIFHPASPRYVGRDAVRTIVDTVKTQYDLICVGVFVDKDEATLTETMIACNLDAVQLHGDEPPELLQALVGRAYKAIRPQTLAEAQAKTNRYKPPQTVPVGVVSRAPDRKTRLLPDILLDAYHPTLHGGTGRVTDWYLAAEVARHHRTMLAGSLTSHNVAEAIRVVQPWGVDVSSGVEADKGRKDADKLRAFIAAVSSVAR